MHCGSAVMRQNTSVSCDSLPQLSIFPVMVIACCPFRRAAQMASKTEVAFAMLKLYSCEGRVVNHMFSLRLGPEFFLWAVHNPSRC